MDIRELYKLNLQNSEKFAELMSVCYTILQHSEIAKGTRDYLKSRVPSFFIEGFQFGYFPTNSELNELFYYINPEELEKLGVIYKKCVYDSGQPEMVYCGKLNNHNLIMPYKDVYGNIIGLVGRTLLSEKETKEQKISKYKNTSIIKGMNLFGLYEAKKEILKQDCVIIVEGQFDCISCHRFGYKNVVALGGSAFTKYHLYLIKRYTNNINLLLDNDFAGAKSTSNIIKRFADKADIKTISLPQEYKDVDIYMRDDKEHNLLREFTWRKNSEQISHNT
jgi:DNA primase